MVKIKVTPARRKKLMSEYSRLKTERSSILSGIKKHRHTLAKLTFADLDSRMKNTFINNTRSRERKLIKAYYKIDKRLNKIDHMF